MLFLHSLQAISDIFLDGKAKLNQETENVTRLEAELNVLGNIDDLTAQKDELQAESRNNRAQLSDYMVWCMFITQYLDIQLFLGRYEAHGC